MTHTGAKHFACLQCDKAFKESDKLQWHERTHTEEKPFVCYQCDKAFAQFNSLKRHERTQSGKKPFACSKCDKAFMHSGEDTWKDSHWRETIYLLKMSQDIYKEWGFEEAWKDPHWR